MELKIPDGKLDRALGAMARVNELTIPLWPGALKPQPLCDPRILGVRFPDDEALRAEMVRQILANDPGQLDNVTGYGGNKVRTTDFWNSAVGKLLTLRALLLFCQTRDVSVAHTADRWANVSRTGDYSAPHAHYDAEAAVVYFLDLGDPDPEAPLSGRFELIDSRIPWCCSSRPECPTRGLLPEILPGTMILFPALLLHFVHPYTGNRPRITLAWNLSEGPEPAGNEERLTQQVKGEIAEVGATS